MSADDPWRNPRGCLCGGPERSAKESQTPPKTSRGTTDGGRARKEAIKNKKPIIITMDKCGRERKWGPLSRVTVWRAGSYWEDMDQEAQVFIEKDRKRREVEVEKRINGESEWFWFQEKNPQPRQNPDDGRDDHPIPEVVDLMQEVTAEERQSEQVNGLMEKVASLEKENLVEEGCPRNGSESGDPSRSDRGNCGAMFQH